jgi:hypothetical protein
MRGGREREIERWKKKEWDDSKMIREKNVKDRHKCRHKNKQRQTNRN